RRPLAAPRADGHPRLLASPRGRAALREAPRGGACRGQRGARLLRGDLRDDRGRGRPLAPLSRAPCRRSALPRAVAKDDHLLPGRTTEVRLVPRLGRARLVFLAEELPALRLAGLTPRAQELSEAPFEPWTVPGILLEETRLPKRRLQLAPHA